MARLPIVGGDTGNWGAVLNDFLEVSLNGDGTIRPGALLSAGAVTSVNATTPQDGNITLTPADIGAYAKPSSGIPSTDLSAAVQSDLTAASTAVQLGGDLGGTNTAPTIAKLQGTTVNAASPTANQVLSYVGGQWVPSTVSSTTVNDATTSTPGIIQLAGDLGGTATSPSVLKVNGVGVSGTPSNGQALIASSGTAAAWSNLPTESNATVSAPGLIQLDGDLGNTATSPEVMSLKGVALPGSPPSTNQVLTATGPATTAWSTPAGGVQLDTSASDLQADTTTGTAVAGTTGKAADAGHQHPLVSHNHTTANQGGQIPVGGISATGTASGSTYLRGDGTWSTLTASSVDASQALVPTAVQASAYAANPGDFVPVDTSGGAVTITLPTAPANYTRVGVKMINSTSNPAAVSIATGGSDVFNKAGGGTTLSLLLLNQGALLQYNSSSGIWYVQTDDLPLSQLDARYQVNVPVAYTAGDYSKIGDTYYFNGNNFYDTTGGTLPTRPLAPRFLNLGMTSVIDFGAVPDGVELQGATISSGSTTLTCSAADFSSADVGKAVCVQGAGSGGINLSTAISAYISSTSVTLTTSASTTVSSAVIVYGTDNTAAFNAAITAMSTAPGFLTRVPNGYYVVAGAYPGTNPSGGSPANAVFNFPVNAASNPTYAIGFVGDIEVGMPGPSVAISGDDLDTTLFGSVVTAIATPSGSKPSIFGANSWVGSPYTNPHHTSNIMAIFKRLTVRQIPYPTGGVQAIGIDMSGAGGAEFEQVRVDTTDLMPLVIQPTNTSVAGIKLPSNNNNFARAHAIKCTVQGYFYGFWFAEHSVADDCAAQWCNTAYIFGLSNHGIQIGRLLAQDNIYTLGPDPGASETGTISQFTIAQLDIEDAANGFWYTPINHVQDPNNYLIGQLAYVRIIANVGRTAGLIINGGQLVSVQYTSAASTLPVSTQTGAYTLSDIDHLVVCNATTAAFTITLPSAVGCRGRAFYVKKSDSSNNAITVATTSDQTIDGSSSASVASQYAIVGAVSDGANWQVIGISSSASFLPISGGTLTGTVNTESLIPSTTDTYSLGSTSEYYESIYSLYYYLNSTAYFSGATAGTATLTGALSLDGGSAVSDVLIAKGENAATQFQVYNNASASTSNQANMILEANTTSSGRTVFQFTSSFNNTTDSTRNSLVQMQLANSGTFTTAMQFNGVAPTLYGALAMPIVAKSSAYTATSSNSTILVSGTTTITLPTAVGVAGVVYIIKKTDSGTTSTLATTSSQTIDGATTLSMATQYEAVTVQSDGSNWWVIHQVATSIL